MKYFVGQNKIPKLKSIVILLGVLCIFTLVFVNIILSWVAPIESPPGDNPDIAFGSGGVVEVLNLKLNPEAVEEPLCDESSRGMLWSRKGGEEEYDDIALCVLDGEEYSWKSLVLEESLLLGESSLDIDFDWVNPTQQPPEENLGFFSGFKNITEVLGLKFMRFVFGDPSCDASSRGTILLKQGNEEESDDIVACVRREGCEGEVYAWESLLSGATVFSCNPFDGETLAFHAFDLQENGDYTVDTKYASSLPVEFVLYEGNQTISSNTSWGNSTADARTLMVRVNGNLTVNSGVTLTSQARKRGMVIFIEGDLNINGTISMTARGASATGDRLLIVSEGSTEYEIPAVGGTGGASVTSPKNSPVGGTSGSNGSDGSPGGGGSGGAALIYDPFYPDGSWTSTSGAGGSATSYSGGTGGGGASDIDGAYSAQAGSSTGGAGGRGRGGYLRSGAGGAGNPGGMGRSSNADAPSMAGQDGTGGLLVLIVSGNVNIGSTGKLESKGNQGGNGGNSGGGGSGGGGINVFHGGSYTNSGTIDVTRGSRGTGSNANGGYGGHGSSRIVQIPYE
jgi:hypothetical protein